MLYEICSLHAIYHEELSAAAARSLARHATDALRTARTRAVVGAPTLPVMLGQAAGEVAEGTRA